MSHTPPDEHGYTERILELENEVQRLKAAADWDWHDTCQKAYAATGSLGHGPEHVIDAVEMLKADRDQLLTTAIELKNTPEPWIEFGRMWREYDGDTDDSFHGTIGDDAVGLLVETAKGDKFLIGDINTDGGACSCCEQLNRDDVIVRYRRVWSHD